MKLKPCKEHFAIQRNKEIAWLTPGTHFTTHIKHITSRVQKTFKLHVIETQTMQNTTCSFNKTKNAWLITEKHFTTHITNNTLRLKT